MVKTISIFNMKGGVGKSTTAYNLAIGLSRFQQQKVLLIDIDPWRGDREAKKHAV